ncbi:50S ribosomal protein L11 methyltransferase [Alicyclobacillus fastidiosus]|uniref:Ribosomal protein L11 methyltransferase n=1 Tax=Alicyclobacillus fastidiosus TaxID=392011 RepID=A0ABY6ZLN6_9BACL|nr:50S ribosomal protein L11 methyltransferase [Alicyclobacillus fastidiosus]WAH43786.1 50S ribosomal protein L11 methyltransferase [Alicyclobacillus fastidiosus]
MHWWQVQFNVTHEASDAVAGLLQEFPDIQGVQLEGIGNVHVPHPEYGEWFDEMIVPTEGVTVFVYFPETHEPGEIRSRVLAVVDKVSEAGLDVGHRAREIRVESVDDSSWLNAWKEHYHPIPVGDDLVIVPVWSQHDLPPELRSRKRIIVEPGMAFGTGTHQTTQLCTQALAQLDLGGKEVLDVGTGTGILAIAAARLGARRVTAIDIDPVAVDAARENVARNDLSDLISVQEGNLLAGYQQDAKFDVAVANILRDIVILLLPQVAQRLNAGGYLLTSGYIDTQAPAVEEALAQNGFEICERYQRDDWVATLAVKS